MILIACCLFNMLKLWIHRSQYFRYSSGGCILLCNWKNFQRWQLCYLFALQVLLGQNMAILSLGQGREKMPFFNKIPRMLTIYANRPFGNVGNLISIPLKGTVKISTSGGRMGCLTSLYRFLVLLRKQQECYSCEDQRMM